MKAALFSIVLLISFSASARPRYGGGYAPAQQNYSQAPVHIEQAKAPKDRVYDENESPRRDLEFNYKYAINNPETNMIKMKIGVLDKQLLEQKDNLFAEVEYANLRRDRKIERVSLPITWDEKGNAYIEVPKLKPQSTYKMTVHFNKYSEDRKTGIRVKSTGEYFAATSGVTPAAQARFKVVTAGLVEVNDWQTQRKGHHNFPYQNVPGGWCGTFQQYCAEPFLKVYGEAPTYPIQKSGAEIPSMKDEPLHGNHGYVGAHKLMVLDYSEDTGQVYTIEGNWGNSVGINRRSPGEIGTLGVITDNFVWKENVDTKKR